MSQLTEFRRSKDESIRADHHSPFTPEQARSFSGLDYYEEAPRLRYELPVERFAESDRVEMQTSTGDVATYLKWGSISFDVDGEPAKLALYRDEEHGDFFLPFADSTSGTETYASGRYLEVRELPGGKLAVDFNYAYNPYCAYNGHWSCPLTPFENRLKVPIRAGEKSFK